MSFTVTDNVKIGEHSTVDEEAEIYDAFTHQTITIGKFTQVAPKVIFYGAVNHPWLKYRKDVSIFSFGWQWKQPIHGGEYTVSRGPINIGNDVWVGRGVTILDGVTIGDGAIIGAMAVVAKDVPPYAIVVGNPGRIVHYRYSEDQIKKLLEIKWWDLKNDIIEELIVNKYFNDIDKFIEYYENNPDKFGAEAYNR
jgi:acetyltransferase-like isoleucine patch superfamily enzyme